MINVAVENSSPASLEARRDAEELRQEARDLSDSAERRDRADKALQSLLASERLHAAALGDLA